MEGGRLFLESSTIYGLGHISATRNSLKIFWVLIVITGFTVAAVIINESFQTWIERPVSTTIETLSITEIKLPKVTVCPPKNTFTNLNYDIMMARNFSLNAVDREEILNYTVEMIQKYNFDDVMLNMSLIEEENRFYNWYHGITQLQIPYWGPDRSPGCTELQCSEQMLRYQGSL